MARFTDALAGGRAPRAWREGIVQSAGAPAAWKRASGWLVGLLDPPRKLRQGPLWGKALEAVTGTSERPAPRVAPKPRRSSASPEPPHGGSGRKAADSGGRKGRRRPGAVDEKKAVNEKRARREPVALTSERRASRELLVELAGSPEADGGMAGDGSRPKAKGAKRSVPRGKTQGKKARDWFDGLSQRVRGKLRRNEATQSHQPDHQPDHPGSMPVDGEPASRALLESCLERGPATGEPASPKPEGPRPVPGPPSAMPAARTAPKGDPDTTAPSSSTGVGPAPVGEASRDLPPRNFSLPDGTLLPSLLPRSASDFNPESASARVLRLAGHRGLEAPAGEDDGELAEKLGRILAEEARRHGIDV